MGRIFKSVVYWLILITGSSATQTSHMLNESENQDILIFPLLRSPNAITMKGWFDATDGRESYQPMHMLFRLQSLQDVIQPEPSESERKVVIGSWQYHRADVNRPSSSVELPVSYGATAFLKKEKPFNAVFIRKDEISNVIMAKLLSKFEQKMVSIWWDSSVLADGLSNWHSSATMNDPGSVVGEMAVGGVNKDRFDDSSVTRFNLKPVIQVNGLPYVWEAESNVDIRVQDRSSGWTIPVEFDLYGKTWVPFVIYEELIRPLREAIYESMLPRKLPKEIAIKISEYSNEVVRWFECDFAERLKALHVGGIEITPNMMFQQVTAEKCIITLGVLSKSHFNKMWVGADIIQHFYFTINWDSVNGDFVQFAHRKEGTRPRNPESPPNSPARTRSTCRWCPCMIC